MIRGLFFPYCKLVQPNLRHIIHRSTILKFSTQKSNPNRKQNSSQDRLQKQQQIQFRKRSLQNAQIKAINDRIENTTGRFNPLVSYILLYKKKFLYLFLMAASITLLIGIATLVGTYEDPFTKKKKIVLVSDQFEKNLDRLLRQIMQSQLNGQFNQTSPSASLSRKSRQLQQYVKETTGRQYKTVVVQGQDQVITILPQSIVVSKNILLSKSIKPADVENVTILMQTLFVQKLHIRELAPSNLFFFLKVKIKGSSISDIKLTNIYSRPYSQAEVQTALKQIENSYNLSAEDIRQSLEKLIQGNDAHSSPFALRNRFRAFV